MALELTFRELLPQLQEEGLAEPSRVERALEAHAAEAGSTPWFVRLLVGFGAWVSAVFLVSFVGAAVFNFRDAALLGLGLFCCAAAIVGRRSSEGVFAGQLALAVGLAGQGMIILATGSLADSPRAAAAATVGIALAMFALYPDRVQAFLSGAGGALAALYLVRELKLPLAADAALLALAVLTHAVLLGRARLQVGPFAERVPAAAAGLVVALLFSLMLRSQEDLFRWLFGHAPSGPRSAPLTLGLGILLLVTAASALREGSSTRPRGLLAGVALAVAVVAALTLRTPGLLGAAGMVALAFHRRSTVLLGVSIVFALAAGTVHYYDLSLSLLHKSAALAATGLVLLGVYALVLRREPEARP